MFGAVPVSEYGLPNELRRSTRLQENSYYNPDGSLSISYKEALIKIFRRRNRCHTGRRFNESVEEQDHKPRVNSEVEEDHRPPDDRTFWITIAKMALMSNILLLCVMIILGHTLHTSELNSYSRLLSKEADLRYNFANGDDGALAIMGMSSEIYPTQGWTNWLRSWWCPKLQMTLHPSSPLVPGNCWPMAGDNGYVTIQLSKPARVSHITIGHIAKVQAPNRDTSSAPRDMTIYGLNLLNGEEKLLGSFTYDHRGPSFQTFALPNVDPETFQNIRILVNSNNGNKDYTCLYSIRVHGEAPAAD